MKKIAFLTPFVPPAVNGIGDYTSHLCRALRDLGMDAHIFTSWGQRPQDAWIHPVIRDWSGTDAPAELKTFHPDAVVLQFVPQLYHPRGICLKLAHLLRRLKKDLGCRVFVTFHEFQTHWELDLKKIFLAGFYRFQTVEMIAQSDAVITTCRAYADILKKYPVPRKVHEIPVGSNVLPVPASKESLEALKNKYGTQGKKMLAIFGRMSGFRSMDTALNVLADIRAGGIDAGLFVLGNARESQPKLYEAFLETAKSLKVQGCVFETGILPAEEISRHLQASDLFLFPQNDGISTRSTTVMSALAHGLPIAARTPRPGNFTGYEIPYAALVRESGDKAFGSAVLELLANKDDKELRQKNTEYWRKNFSWEVIARAYLAAMGDS